MSFLFDLASDAPTSRFGAKLLLVDGARVYPASFFRQVFCDWMSEVLSPILINWIRIFSYHYPSRKPIISAKYFGQTLIAHFLKTI
jgi:hypothetical protein